MHWPLLWFKVEYKLPNQSMAGRWHQRKAQMMSYNGMHLIVARLNKQTCKKTASITTCLNVWTIFDHGRNLRHVFQGRGEVCVFLKKWEYSKGLMHNWWAEADVRRYLCSFHTRYCLRPSTYLLPQSSSVIIFGNIYRLCLSMSCTTVPLPCTVGKEWCADVQVLLQN